MCYLAPQSLHFGLYVLHLRLQLRVCCKLTLQGLNLEQEIVDLRLQLRLFGVPARGFQIQVLPIPTLGCKTARTHTTNGTVAQHDAQCPTHTYQS